MKTKNGFRAASLALLLSLMSGASSPALADSWYASLTGGAVFKPKSDISQPSGGMTYNTGSAGSIALGYALGNGLRFEAEGGYSRNSTDKYNGDPAFGHLDNWTALGNAYYDFDTGSAWVPYIGAGVGMSHTAEQFSANGITNVVDDADNVLVYQGSVGIGHAINKSITVFSGYRYTHFNKTEVSTNTGARPHFDDKSHMLQAGLRYNF